MRTTPSCPEPEGWIRFHFSIGARNKASPLLNQKEARGAPKFDASAGHRGRCITAQDVVGGFLGGEIDRQDYEISGNLWENPRIDNS
jgi:hypothetical protein